MHTKTPTQPAKNTTKKTLQKIDSASPLAQALLVAVVGVVGGGGLIFLNIWMDNVIAERRNNPGRGSECVQGLAGKLCQDVGPHSEAPILMR